MKLLDSKFYSILLFISNIFLLNIIWLVMCLPLITIFPATAAMFGVVRQWVVHKDVSIFAPFFRYFKENLKQSLLLEVIWVFLAAFLVIDYTIALKMGFSQSIILPILFVISFLFLLGSVFLFPTMVQFNTTTGKILKNTLLLAISYFPITLILCLVTVLIAFILYIFPLSILFIFSAGAYCSYFLCHFAFKRVTQVNVSET